MPFYLQSHSNPLSLCERGRDAMVQWNSMIEGAKEELEILEMQHPNEFHTLKLEFKAFISHLQSLNTTSISPSPSAATQESSSRKKRKRCCVDEEVKASNLKGGSYGRGIKRRCKTDAVLERAQQCLRKIQHLKTTFFY